MRYSIQSADDRTVITIRPRRDLFAFLFLVWWIALWVAGEITLGAVVYGGTAAILSGDVPNTISTFRYVGPFIGLGLIVWTLVGAAMVYALLWELAGCEEITLDGKSLAIRRRVFGLSRQNVYPKAEISQPHIDSNPGWWLSNLEFWGLAGGKMGFDHGGKLVRFGRGIDNVTLKELEQAIDTALAGTAPSLPREASSQ